MAAPPPGKAHSLSMGKRIGGRAVSGLPFRHQAAGRPGNAATTILPALLLALSPATALAAPTAIPPAALAGVGIGIVTGVLATLAWRAWRARAATAPPSPDAVALLEALPCAAFLKDVGGRYLAVNRAFEAHYQCQREHVLGRTLAQTRAVHGVDTDVLLQAEGLHQSGETVDCSIVHGDSEGPRAWRLRLHPVPGSGGIGAVLGTLAEVTGLHGARPASEAATEAAGTFLSLVSHEVRTPIAGALGLVELLAHTPLDQEQRQMLGMLEESVEGLLEILSDILDFSRLQAGELQLDSAQFDLRALVDEVVAAAAAPASGKGVRLHARLDSRLAAAYRGDGGRMRQILSCLLSSTLHSTTCGDVELHVEVAGADARRHQLRLSLAGSGACIAPAGLADDATTPAGDSACPGGQALGLAICRHLVHLMGGELVLGSEEGGDCVACVELELPVERAPVPVPALAGDGLLERLQAVRVLVAEDHPINRAVISRQLQRLGCPHDVVGDGQQALQALASTRYDLLVTDCHMPVLDGYGLVRRIRADEHDQGRPRLPVLALSASVLPGQVRRCIDAGMDDFLARPVQLHELELKLARHLGAGVVPAAAATAAAAADSAAYRQLALLMEAYGSLRQVRGILQGLLETCHEDLAALDQAFARGDREAQHELLHRICGSLRLVGEPPGPPLPATADARTRRDALLEHVRWLEALLHSLGPPGTTAAARNPPPRAPWTGATASDEQAPHHPCR